MNQIGCAVWASEARLAREQHRESLMQPAIEIAVNELTNPGAEWCPMNKFNFATAIEEMPDDKWAEFLALAKSKDKHLAVGHLMALVLAYCKAQATEQVDADVEENPDHYMPDPEDYYHEN